MFGPLNICVPYSEYSTFRRDRMINGSGRWFHFENDTELVFGSFYYKPFADLSYFEYKACGVCYSLSTGSRIVVRLVLSESRWFLSIPSFAISCQPWNFKTFLQLYCNAKKRKKTWRKTWPKLLPVHFAMLFVHSYRMYDVLKSSLKQNVSWTRGDSYFNPWL